MASIDLDHLLPASTPAPAPEVFRGVMRLGMVTIADRAFTGNGCVIHGGTRLGKDSLLAVLSVSRHNVPKQRTYVGSPAVQFSRAAPSVKAADDNDELRNLTLAPSWSLRPPHPPAVASG